MSIIAYVGLPGSGKSYGAVENVLLPALRQGRIVVTNIPLTDKIYEISSSAINLKHFEINDNGRPVYDDGSDLTDSIINGALYLIDECQLIWGSGLKANQFKLTDKNFFTKHRHYSSESHSCEIVLLTQDLSNISNFIRSLVEETYKSNKLTAVGSSKNYRVDVYSGAVKGQKPPERFLINQLFGTYKPDVYEYYVSQTNSTSAFNTSELKVDKRGNVLKSPLIMFGMPASIIALIFGFSQALSFINPEPSKKIDQPVNNEQIKNDKSVLQSQPKTQNNNIPLDDSELYKSSNNSRIVAIIGDKRIISDDSSSLGYISNSVKCTNQSYIDLTSLTCNDSDSSISSLSFYSSSPYHLRNKEQQSSTSSSFDSLSISPQTTSPPSKSDDSTVIAK